MCLHKELKWMRWMIIVVQKEGGRIGNYEWVGIVSVLVLVCCVLIGNKIFSQQEKTHQASVSAAVDL